MKKFQSQGRFGRFMRNCSGTTAIEFALVFPVLFLMLGMIIETGLFLSAQYVLQEATTSAARQIGLGRVGPATANAGAPNQMALADFKALVCGNLLNLVVPDCPSRIVVDVRRAGTFGALAQVMPQSALSVGAQTAGGGYAEVFQPGARGQPGSLIVTYDWSFFFGNIAGLVRNVQGLPGVWRLAGVAVYQNEF